MANDRDRPWLFTPGPINTDPETKAAMQRDYGSRDTDFIALTARVRERLAAIANAGRGYVCVPIQGSGTFAVEAALGTLVPRSGKVLVLANGVYGRRIAQICEISGRAFTLFETGETEPPDPAKIAAALAADPEITHVVAVHCETTSGILNPLEEIAAVTRKAGRKLIVDAMSTFGILPLDAGKLGCEAIVASSNKCLEGVPGIGFVVARSDALAESAGNCHSLALDLHEQWRFLEASGQWRFTPPTHVLAALDAALDLYDSEGGSKARLARYRRNCEVLVAGMRRLGFETLIPDRLQAPVIVTFRVPEDPAFRFESFYEALRRRGFVIYPGKLTKAETFRIGCIGAIGETQMTALVNAVAEVMAEQGIGRRAASSASA